MKKKINFKKMVLLLFLVYLCYFLVSQGIAIKRISAEINNEKLTAEKLQVEQNNLKDKVELSKTDKYKEILARELLNLIKEGETPVINSAKK
jgi:cell division protein FtsB